MKKGLILFLLFAGAQVFGQKPPANLETLKTWPSISQEAICNDGKVVSYVVSSDSLGRKMFVRALDGTWEENFWAPRGGFLFSADSRWGMCVHGQDTLSILELANGRERRIAGVVSFKIPEGGDGRWMGYLDKVGALTLVDLNTNEELKYARVKEYKFSLNGQVLLVVSELDKHKNKELSLDWVEPGKKIDRMIWRGVDVRQLSLNRSEKQVAFIADKDTSGRKDLAVYYYKQGMESARIWVDGESEGMGSKYTVAPGELNFSPDGKMAVFHVTCVQMPGDHGRAKASVDVWRYGSDFLQPFERQMEEAKKTRSFVASVLVGSSIVRRLELDISPFIELSRDSGMTKAVFKTYVNIGAGYRNPADRPDIYIEDTRTGVTRCIARGVLNAEPHISPGGRYVYWYDQLKRGYFAYEEATGMTRNISGKVPYALYDEHWDVAAAPYAYGLAAWLEGDSGVLVYDRYDIWLLDPMGKNWPVNLTGGYGRRTGTMLRYAYTNGHTYYNGPAVNARNRLLLCGFNERTKFNGFFVKRSLERGSPELLVSGPELFYFSDQLGIGMPRLLLKAKDKDQFLLTRMSATEYANLVTTTDFRKFEPVTTLAPERTISWLTAELWHWQTFKGTRGDAIVYKPENFDEHKRYPVIFTFYQRLTDGLNKFLNVEPSSGPVNIPWFVSNGYVVVCPDIHYTVGAPGQSVYDYVASAAEAIGKEPWVNKAAIGIYGHSWGGMEVNSLLTRSKVFAAACSAEGASDLVSLSASCQPLISETFGFVEQSVYRMGKTIWEDPLGYVKNSPVYGADKVTTPLLLMDNPEDQNVPWAQGIEMFTALNRLGKRVWLLEYEGEDHTLLLNENLWDFTVRLSQFFDHFLKGIPAPDWMESGHGARP